MLNRRTTTVCGVAFACATLMLVAWTSVPRVNAQDSPVPGSSGLQFHIGGMVAAKPSRAWSWSGHQSLSGPRPFVSAENGQRPSQDRGS